MITNNLHLDNERKSEGLENKVQQNRGLNSNNIDRESIPSVSENLSPIDRGGVQSRDLDKGLEEQWLWVRDEYFANYPDVADVENESADGGFSSFIEQLAERRQRSTEEIQDEIMNWSRAPKSK